MQTQQSPAPKEDQRHPLELGAYLRLLLGRRGLRGQDFAPRIGIDPTQLSRILNGTSGTTPARLRKIAACLEDLTDEERDTLFYLGGIGKKGAVTVAGVRLTDGEILVPAPDGGARKPLSEEVAEIKQMLAAVLSSLESLKRIEHLLEMGQSIEQMQSLLHELARRI